MPIEAASVHFLIGMCQSELGRPLGALDAFNNAIRVNPDYAEVTIYTGWSQEEQLVTLPPSPLPYHTTTTPPPKSLELILENIESMRTKKKNI